ncbi:hypothetical protein AAG906_013210 [Vitis piasezkii]
MLTYESASEFLHLNLEEEVELKILSEAAAPQLRWRRNQGAIDTSTSETCIKVANPGDPEPSINLYVEDQADPAMRLVTEMMILCGEAVATYGSCNNIPLPYRGQPQSNVDTSAFAHLPEGPARSSALVKILHAAVWILTARGGMTSHAVVTARGWGRCCVSSCSEIRVNDIEKVIIVGDKVIKEDDWISLNGTTGEVISGKQALAPSAPSGDLDTFRSWADQIRHLKVMANADTLDDALTARNNGTQGSGLCRTEHMFFASDERMKALHINKGGLVVDAEVATALRVGIVNPMASGIGDGSFMTVQSSSISKSEAFGMRKTTPLAASQNMYENNPRAKYLGTLAMVVLKRIADLRDAWLINDSTLMKSKSSKAEIITAQLKSF